MEERTTYELYISISLCQAPRRTHIRVEEQASRNDYHVLKETKYVYCGGITRMRAVRRSRRKNKESELHIHVL